MNLISSYISFVLEINLQFLLIKREQGFAFCEQLLDLLHKKGPVNNEADVNNGLLNRSTPLDAAHRIIKYLY